MRKLTEHDLTNTAGSTVKGYHIENIRVKRGTFTDSDHYGIILGRNINDYYVTWQFHLDDNEKPSVYWGHYFQGNKEAAIQDFNTRDLDIAPELSSEYWDCSCNEKYIQSNNVDCCPVCGAERDEMPDSRKNEVNEGIHFAGYPNSTKKFKVTITEKLQKVVTVEAIDQQEAEQIVSDQWKNSEYILDAENFVDVEFTVCENNED